MCGTHDPYFADSLKEGCRRKFDMNGGLDVCSLCM